MRNFLIGVLLAVSCAPALAQIYKWVDANGVTHYGEKPPETGKAKELQLHEASPASGSQAKAGDPAWQDKERAFKQRQTEREQTAAKLEKDKAAREEECKRAHAQLADLRSSGRAYETNDKGERVFLSDEQRDAQIAAREQEYNQHCN